MSKQTDQYFAMSIDSDQTNLFCLIPNTTADQCYKIITVVTYYCKFSRKYWRAQEADNNLQL